jgi:putative transposase
MLHCTGTMKLWTRPTLRAPDKTGCRPNGPGECSPGLRSKADALGQRAPPPGGLKGRESSRLTAPQTGAGVTATKDRERTLPDEIRPDLHAYMGGTLKGLGCLPIEINTEPDPLHGLFLLARTEALSDVVGHLKKSSNDWLRSRGPQFASFFWQAGFGAFSVSQSQVEDVRAYIRNQREHHRVKSFQEELRAFLKAYEIEFDERYVWD